jgi:ABC-type transporter MlaC component
MKSILAAGVVVVIVAAATMGQTAAPQSQPEKALQDAAAARVKSMTSGDAEGWGKYTTDDFIVIEADGTIKTKAQRMTEIKSTPNSPAGANPPTDQKWRMYGSSTAVSTMQGSIDGEPTRVTVVWVKQQGEWKVASVQLTTIAAGK